MPYTLGEAARASGKSKPTIAKAVRTGRLSATRREDGCYQIDEAELSRVYPVIGPVNGNFFRSLTPRETAVDWGNPLTGEVEKWRTLAEEREATIRDLRARLDAEAEERRRLTAVLTDQRVAPPTPPRRRWLPWRR